MIYAILKKDGSSIVKGISRLAGEVIDPLMIEIQEYNESLVGKKWDGQKFVESGIIPPTPVDPLAEVKTKLDKLVADLTEVKADVKMIKAKG